MRRVLKIENETVKVSDTLTVDLKRVWYIKVDSETSTTYRTESLMLLTYVDNKRSLFGHAVRYFDKPVSVSKRNLFQDKRIQAMRLDSMRREADSESFRSYCLTLENLSGRVIFFDKRSGEGMIEVPHLNSTFSVYGCNLDGRRTWYPETSCVYLNEGEVHGFCLKEVSSGLTVSGIKGIFDAEKWDSLDQSRLAFKVDAISGELESGLFA